MMSGTRRKPGLMGPFVEGFRSRLVELGYTPGSTRGLLKGVGQLGRWMETERVQVDRLGIAEIDAFTRARLAGGFRRVPSRSGLVLLLDYLREVGAVVVGPLASLSVLDAMVGEYRQWLVVERGLAPPTVTRYETLARRFLGMHVDADGAVVIGDLTGADVSGFLRAECARLSVGAAKGRVADLRSLLRFLYLQELTPLALANSVPPVAGWHDTGVPGSMSAADVELLLDGCKRDCSTSTRDFAILMLLARLGLRSIEVARLELSDIDWRAGEIAVLGKARRRDTMPLPCDVGDALVAYLTNARPDTCLRELFLTAHAPLRPIRADLVGDVVRRACAQVGLQPVGAHRLRHALATDLLRHGVTLTEISQVLRHSDLATTAIYAKVDIGALSQVARPWPGAPR
jgi:site-specific recombinase XerD